MFAIYKLIKVILETGYEVLKIKNEKNNHSVSKISEQISYKRLKSFAVKSQLPFISKFDNDDFEIRKHWTSFWILSPIIGKKSLREGKDDFIIAITKIENKRPSFTIIFAPLKNELFIGIKNKAYKIENISLLLNLNLDEILTEKNRINKPIEGFFFNILKSRNRMNYKIEKFLNDFKLHKSGSIREIVDESPMNLIGMAEGKYDFYPHLKTIYEWDIAPFDALITASGNRITQNDGILPLEYNSKKFKFPAFIAKNNFDIDSIDLKE
jgi:3'(2'), 5'-bisphosphate nucleotidase